VTKTVPNRPFYIYLANSDRTLIVGRKQTALPVLVDAGVDIKPGCMLGGCGICVTDFVEGDQIHNDICLNGSERETHFFPCV